jgi:hypothetical protein
MRSVALRKARHRHKVIGWADTMGAQKVHLSAELASNEAAGMNMSTPSDVGDIAFSTNYLGRDLSTMALQKGGGICQGEGRHGCQNRSGFELLDYHTDPSGLQIILRKIAQHEQEKFLIGLIDFSVDLH